MTEIISLKQLFSKRKLFSLLKPLIRELGVTIVIEDKQGNLLFGKPAQGQTFSHCFPITIQRRRIGSVKGEDKAQLIAQLLSYLAQTEQLVISDELTHLANRRYFNRYLHQEWLRACRERKSLSLIICDLDYFKLYNDHFGHLAGDQCLKKIAQTLERVVKRPADLVSRYGGEEFAIILPSTNSLGAQKVAQAIREGVEELQLPHPLSPISSYVTISLGVATTIPTHSYSPENLFTIADQALYQAKEAGRNGYVCLIVRPQQL